jgi:adenylylsulfate reductase subunit B
MYVCPSDIMQIDASIGKAYNIEPDLCWECYACVKSCPQSAMAIRGYGDVVPLGATLTPLRNADSITWFVTFRGGETKRFRYVIRTTPWSSIEPHKGLPPPRAEELKRPGLCGQAKFLGAPDMPMVTAS